MLKRTTNCKGSSAERKWESSASLDFLCQQLEGVFSCVVAEVHGGTYLAEGRVGPTDSDRQISRVQASEELLEGNEAALPAYDQVWVEATQKQNGILKDS